MTDQGQLDVQTLRYLRENAETEHMLLTPFRLMSKATKALMFVLFYIAWFLFTLLGWTVNVGEYSLENRREAICDARVYLPKCDSSEIRIFNEMHKVTDYDWDAAKSRFAIPSIGGGPEWLVSGEVGSHSEERRAPNGWIDWKGGEFFTRSNDVFRRKSAQMDYAIEVGSLSLGYLRQYIAITKGEEQESVPLPDAPVIEIRTGLAPAHSMSSEVHVTYGLCLKQECQPDDLNYALFWGDVMWTVPALGKHQQHAVDALLALDSESFWLREAHENGIYDDAATLAKFQAFRDISNLLKAN